MKSADQTPAGLPSRSLGEGWFFSDARAAQRLRDEAATLRDKPFVKFQQDCVWLAERLFAAAGVVEGFNFPRSAADYSRHVHNNRILDFLRGTNTESAKQSGRLASIFAELPLPEKTQLSAFRFTYEPPFLPGDLLIMKSASKKDRGVWHMPVMLDDHNFIHCAFPAGVTQGDILAPNYSGLLIAVFRARKLTADGADNTDANPKTLSPSEKSAQSAVKKSG